MKAHSFTWVSLETLFCIFKSSNVQMFRFSNVQSKKHWSMSKQSANMPSIFSFYWNPLESFSWSSLSSSIERTFSVIQFNLSLYGNMIFDAFFLQTIQMNSYSYEKETWLHDTINTRKFQWHFKIFLFCKSSKHHRWARFFLSFICMQKCRKIIWSKLKYSKNKSTDTFSRLNTSSPLNYSCDKCHKMKQST